MTNHYERFNVDDRVCIREENGRLFRVGTVSGKDEQRKGIGVMWDAEYDGGEWTWPDQWARLELYTDEVRRQATEAEQRVPFEWARHVPPDS